MPLSDELRERMRELEAKATPGPLSWMTGHQAASFQLFQKGKSPGECRYPEALKSPDDAAFFANARTFVPAALEELDNWDRRLADLQSAICSYCGHKTPRENKSPEDFNAELQDHIIQCDKRPENGMLKVIYALSVALGVDLDTVSKENPPQGMIDAFNAAWQKICNGRDQLVQESAKLRVALGKIAGGSFIPAGENRLPQCTYCHRRSPKKATNPSITHTKECPVYIAATELEAIEDAMKTVGQTAPSAKSHKYSISGMSEEIDGI